RAPEVSLPDLRVVLAVLRRPALEILRERIDRGAILAHRDEEAAIGEIDRGELIGREIRGGSEDLLEALARFRVTAELAKNVRLIEKEARMAGLSSEGRVDDAPRLGGVAQSEKRSCVRSLSIDVVRARLRGLAEILEGLRGGDRLPRPLDEELRLHESLEALHLLAGGGEEEKGGKASHLEALRDGGG